MSLSASTLSSTVDINTTVGSNATVWNNSDFTAQDVVVTASWTDNMAAMTLITSSSDNYGVGTQDGSSMVWNI